MLNLVLNILWVVFGGGFIVALQYALAGLILCITVVGIPFGMQCFKLAGLAIWPFGASIEEAKSSGTISFIMNVVWILLAGIWIFLTQIGLAAGLAVTIIGIPFAWQHLKLAMLALAPFGQTIR